MRRVLVAGGAGFLGSHMCALELNQGNHVICVDNLCSSNGSNIEELKSHPNFTFLQHDVRETDMRVYGSVDYIYNMACPASPYWYAKTPVDTMMTSVLGMKNMLDLAGLHGARILYTSTSEVYGDPDVHPQVETYNGNVSITGPRACYDEGKRAAETLCHDYRRQYGVDVVVTRLFNTYGPKMAENDGRVVSNFITQALTGSDITVYGDGSQSRSFCYVDNMIGILYELMHMNVPLPLPLNVGNPEEYTIGNIAEVVCQMVPSGSQVVYKELPEDDPKVRRPDISRLQEALGHGIHFTSLREGLTATIDYFTNHHNSVHDN